MQQSLNSQKHTNSSSTVNSLKDKASDLMKMNEDHLEGESTKAIENQTSKIPSGIYLALAVGSMALSAVLAASSKTKYVANFVGQLAPSFLILGLYNKIVKTHGSDKETPV